MVSLYANHRLRIIMSGPNLVETKHSFVRYSYSLKFTPKAGGEEMELNGKLIFILKRQSDGSWKITHYIANHNTPSPPPENKE